MEYSGAGLELLTGDLGSGWPAEFVECPDDEHVLPRPLNPVPLDDATLRLVQLLVAG